MINLSLMRYYCRWEIGWLVKTCVLSIKLDERLSYTAELSAIWIDGRLAVNLYYILEMMSTRARFPNTFGTNSGGHERRTVITGVGKSSASVITS